MSWPPAKPPYNVKDALAAADKRRGLKAPRAKRKTMELDFQEELVGVLRAVLIAPARCWFVPNGGNLSKVQRARFQKAGLTPGVHDVHLIWRVVNTSGFGTIELKAGKGKTTPEQDAFGDDMLECGHSHMVAYADDGVEWVLERLEEWGVPMRRWTRGA